MGDIPHVSPNLPLYSRPQGPDYNYDAILSTKVIRSIIFWACPLISDSARMHSLVLVLNLLKDNITVAKRCWKGNLHPANWSAILGYFVDNNRQSI